MAITYIRGGHDTLSEPGEVRAHARFARHPKGSRGTDRQAMETGGARAWTRVRASSAGGEAASAEAKTRERSTATGAGPGSGSPRLWATWQMTQSRSW